MLSRRVRLGEGEDDALELELGQVEGGFERLGFGTDDERAGAADDVDVAGVAGFEGQGHGGLRIWVVVGRV